MPTEYDQIRIAVSLSLAVDNLRNITTLSLEILQNRAPRHPAIFVTLACLSRWVADAWDGIPLSVQVADRVEGQLKPHLQALLNVAGGEPAEVLVVLDAAAAAFRMSLSEGLDH